MRSSRLLLAATCLALLAGCSEASPGSPVAAGTSERPPTSTSDTETSSEPTSKPPTSGNRPKAIDMAAVDPCTVYRSVRPSEFGIDGEMRGGTSSVFPGSKDCFATGLKANIDFGLTAVVSEGFDSYAASINPDKATVTEGEVAGFRMALIKPKRPASCFVAVDVNDGQMLYLVVGTGVGEPPTPQEKMCGLLPGIAESAMKALGA